MTTLESKLKKEEIKDIFEASKKVKQGYFYVGKLEDIARKRKNSGLNKKLR